MMKGSFLLLAYLVSVLELVLSSSSANLVEFNYDETREGSYGPKDWNQVTCPDLETCRGWPDAWEMAIDWKLEDNSW